MEQKELTCRSCGSHNMELILSLGETTLADRILTKEQLTLPEIKAPLDLAFCHDCSLTQITHSVDPGILFSEDYPYFSSVSPSLLKHFADSSHDIMERRKLDHDSLVFEAASNDGYMLRNFAKKGIPVFGVDPAKAPVENAIKEGIPTLCDFFTESLAKQLRDGENKAADVFLANNVLAHIPDLNGFVEGIRIILKDNGLAVIEAKYVVDLVDHIEFDTIYHQHMFYYSLTALDHLFRNHSLYINDVQRVWTQGGSLRIFVEKHEHVGDSVKEMLENERKRGVDKIDFYKDFALKVQGIKKSLRSLLVDLKKQNKKIAAYGAAAKATTLLTYAGIDRDTIDYVVDLNKFKQGKYLDGSHIPIYPPEQLMIDRPDYVLLLAWNYVDEIMQQQKDYKDSGGHFILPLPEVKTI